MSNLIVVLYNLMLITIKTAYDNITQFMSIKIIIV